MHVAACLIASTKLREARALLTEVMPTLATQPQQAKRIQPIMNAQLAEIARLQPYLTVAAPPEGLESLTVDDVAVLAGQPILVDPGVHTVVARTRLRTQTLQLALAPAERKTISLAAEQDKLAENEFATGSQYLQSGCAALERAITSPDAGPTHLTRLAWCHRLSAKHAEADALWKTIQGLSSETRPNAPAERQAERELRVADETLRQACARFQASLDLDADLATELAVTACQLRAGKLRLARSPPPSSTPSAAPRPSWRAPCSPTSRSSSPCSASSPAPASAAPSPSTASRWPPTPSSPSIPAATSSCRSPGADLASSTSSPSPSASSSSSSATCAATPTARTASGRRAERS
jgi:hypothetical protein